MPILKPFNNITERNVINDESIRAKFTDDNKKNEALAVYTEIAYKELKKVILSISSTKLISDPLNMDSHKEIEVEIDGFTKNDPNPNTKYFTKDTFAILKNYLWKSYSDTKNKSGDPLTEQDIKHIKLLCFKLKCQRNYQSHIWHDDSYMLFDVEGAFFIMEKFVTALDSPNINSSLVGNKEKIDASKLSIKNAKFKYDYIECYNIKYELFDNEGDYYKLTLFGRMFFLSFFLTTGEMNSFLSQMKGTKKQKI